MTDQWWMGKDLKGGDCSLIWGTIPVGDTGETARTLVKVTHFWADMWTSDIRNTKHDVRYDVIKVHKGTLTATRVGVQRTVSVSRSRIPFKWATCCRMDCQNRFTVWFLFIQAFIFSVSCLCKVHYGIHPTLGSFPDLLCWLNSVNMVTRLRNETLIDASKEWTQRKLSICCCLVTRLQGKVTT
jgi:hypothetical protein